MKESRSENDGLNALKNTDLKVLSIGISTAGEAEIKMVKDQPGRSVVATTLDQNGLEYVREKIKAAGYDSQIEARFEDIAKEDLPYENETFNFIYARLVLHYLTAQQLHTALSSMYRILKNDGRVFIVVRSVESQELHDGVIGYDSNTHITTYTTAFGARAERYFHTVTSISGAVEEAGFHINSVDVFDEDLSVDFNREGEAVSNNLIELVARK